MICEVIYFNMCAYAEKSSLLTEENDKWLIVSIALFYLLAASLLINIGLTVTVLRIRGKSSCRKGTGFNILCCDFFMFYSMCRNSYVHLIQLVLKLWR